MFFNMVLKTSDDLGECDQEIKAAIKVPTNDEIIKYFIKALNEVSIIDQVVKSGHIDKHDIEDIVDNYFDDIDIEEDFSVQKQLNNKKAFKDEIIRILKNHYI